MESNNRIGDWITTYSGVKFYPLDPRFEEFNSEDVAHALSLTCRFGGHCRDFYSVGQHAIHVYHYVREKYPTNYHLQFLALNHDDTEAYMGDMVKPLKVNMPEFSEVEDKIASVIYAGLGLAPSEEDYKIVKWADNMALMTERRDLVNHYGYKWMVEAEPHPMKIYAIDNKYVKQWFLDIFDDLQEKISKIDLTKVEFQNTL